MCKFYDFCILFQKIASCLGAEHIFERHVHELSCPNGSQVGPINAKCAPGCLLWFCLNYSQWSIWAKKAMPGGNWCEFACLITCLRAHLSAFSCFCRKMLPAHYLSFVPSLFEAPNSLPKAHRELLLSTWRAISRPKILLPAHAGSIISILGLWRAKNCLPFSSFSLLENSCANPCDLGGSDAFVSNQISCSTLWRSLSIRRSWKACIFCRPPSLVCRPEIEGRRCCPPQRAFNKKSQQNN